METPANSGEEVCEEALKYSEEEEQKEETENLPSHEEGINVVSSISTDVLHENVNPSEHALKKTKTVTTTTKSPTVQRILDLLNEMESASHLEHSGLQKFHPCPLCSGKLITV